MNSCLNCVKSPFFHGIVGASFLILGALTICLPLLVKIIVIESKVKLDEDDDSFSHWYWQQNRGIKKNAVYFFDVVNPVEVEQFGAIPNLRQVGPITYAVTTRKENILFHGENRVAYEPSNSFKYLPDDSEIDENTVISTINAPLIFALKMAQEMAIVPDPLRAAIARGVADGLFIRRTVRQLLFDGYPDILVSAMKLVNDSLLDTGGKMSWMSEINGQNRPKIVAYTGKHDKDYVNSMFAYNGHETLPYWDAKTECANLDKVFIDQNLVAPVDDDDKDKIKFLLSSACRHLTFKFDEEVDVYAGGKDDWEVEVKRFVLDKRSFMNSIDHEPNECYDMKNLSSKAFAHPDGRGLLSGMLDASRCHGGLPVIVTQPHFLGASKDVNLTILGLSPNKEHHQSFLEVFPEFGFTVRTAIKHQINVPTEYAKVLEKYKDVKSVILPVLWFDETTKISRKLGKKLWHWTKFVQIIGYSAGGTFLFLGLLMVGFAIVYVTGFGFSRDIAARGDNAHEMPTIAATYRMGSGRPDPPGSVTTAH